MNIKKYLLLLLACNNTISMSWYQQYFTSVDPKTAFVEACEKGDVEAVRQLINKLNMNESISDKLREYPIYYAYKSGNLEILQMLIDNGANIDSCYSKWLIDCICEDDNVEALKIIYIKARNPLIKACTNQAINCIKFLIKNAGVKGFEHVLLFKLLKPENYRDNINILPIITLLIKAGCNIHSIETEFEKEKYIDEPINRWNRIINRVSIAINESSSLIHFACKHSTLNIVKLLVKNGALLDSITSLGRTLLHSTRDLDIAKYLINNGVDLYAKDFEGDTALHSFCADKKCNFDLIKYMVKQHPETMAITNNKGEVPFQFIDHARMVNFIAINSLDIEDKYLAYIDIRFYLQKLSINNSVVLKELQNRPRSLALAIINIRENLLANLNAEYTQDLNVFLAPHEIPIIEEAAQINNPEHTVIQMETD